LATFYQNWANFFPDRPVTLARPSWSSRADKKVKKKSSVVVLVLLLGISRTDCDKNKNELMKETTKL
jgi:hypothetical protein